jgi:hypothetical protein
MNHLKAAVVCYALAVGFILAVAFHSSDKTQATAHIRAQAASNTLRAILGGLDKWKRRKLKKPIRPRS